MLIPVACLWKNGAFIPATSYQLKRCQEHFEDGKRYALIEHQERSINSHNHYFAALHDAWQNLPEDIGVDFPTVEHLRKRALISTGYYDQRSVVCADNEEARRVAAFIRPMDEFALVAVNGPAVVVRTPKSQTYRAMDRKTFSESKEKVLGWVWDLVGVDPDTGNREAGQAA
ncbi:hypothetical protein [Methyloceanibacter caenitepidi]|uniref:Phage protein n=1 Tax=Methyloceanibacter caenitepidi TaxID=1384459 RepID=A0A0A8K622_9HYPH|nr:hypothetical protein [Methyloceanibacter caenitepidi]BAQ18355.1 phage protein [Methyloceanibacter caenitepidi]